MGPQKVYRYGSAASSSAQVMPLTDGGLGEERTLIWTRVNLCAKLAAEIYSAAFPEAEGKMPTQEASAFFRFSTDDLPEAARAKVVREFHEHATLPSRPEPIEPLPDYRVRLDVTKRTLPGAIIIRYALRGVSCGPITRIGLQ